MVRCAAGVCACLRSCSPWPGPARCEATSGNRFTSVSSRSTTRRTTVSTVRRTWCCPTGTGPATTLRIPLIISPHGRGVSAEENVDRWGDLPSIGSFAVVNPEGQGRRFARFSWGYAGQIDDLARMPRILRATDSVAADRAAPDLRVRNEHGRPGRRCYWSPAIRSSLPAPQHSILSPTWPRVTATSRGFAATAAVCVCGVIRSASVCAHSRAKRSAARRRACREPTHGRSPITYARAIARSGVPAPALVEPEDHVVGSQDQSAALARKLRRLNPAAPLHTFVGSWPHSADMRPYFMLIPALKKFDLAPDARSASVRARSPRPVHPLLPWHNACATRTGSCCPGYRPNAGLGYDRVLRLGWNFIERGVPRDPRTRSKVYLNYAVFDGQTLRGIYWQHNPAFPQRCVRRLAGLLVSVLGRPAGDRRGARDARLPARTRNFAGGLGVAAGPVHHGLRG